MLLGDRHRSLVSVLPDAEGLPDQHRQTVASTWSLSIEYANRLSPAGVAGGLLEVASVLDPNGIPAEVFGSKAVLEMLADQTTHIVDAADAREGLACLHRLGLITWDPGSAPRAVRVHALVQRAARDSLSQGRLSVLARVAADALCEAWPEVERDTALGQVLRANTEAAMTASGDGLWEPDGHAVLFRGGRSLRVWVGGRGRGLLPAAARHGDSPTWPRPPRHPHHTQ
ncbi:hypothetical protein ACFFS4_40070 [Kutzneria kofuensis]|uniref:DUF7779 domain-containing protein n=1 Tax=Kutzneria kofuensis TaxID=103725 RepID=A0A7W9NLM8_9PSEU|nr:hypothetical protein [Kutzneria kofuensis]MBB5896646.1 hypothetical protein [Kutzneria kofuensis]